MKGIPTYIRHTTAWADRVPLHDRAAEEIGVSFQAKGGGTHGEFRLVWKELTGYEHGAMQVQSFVDGLGALLDERILDLLRTIRRADSAAGRKYDISPDRVEELLLAAGIRPGLYHLRGILDRGNVSYEDRLRIEREIEKLLYHERGSR